MSDEDEKAGLITLARPEEEALRLKTLAEQKYNSNNLKSALKFAKRAHKLHPSINGLPEMLTAFKILRTAAAPIFESSSETQKSTPDYYKILQVERFSHINTIKKQYKKLALTLHPDKNPFVATEEAFKLVGEAARVLSDKIRRKEYDMRLRIAMQSKAAEEVGLGTEGAGETFWTACSTCRLLHKFERKYLGHNLMCPRCKKTFKAMEVEENRNNEGDAGSVEKNESVGGGQTRVSARIRERVAKGGHLGIVEKCGLGVKRKISSVGEVLERSGVKVARNMGGDGDLLKDWKSKKVEKVGKSGGGDGGGIEEFGLKKAQKLVNVDKSGYPGNKDIAAVNELRSRRVGGKVRDGIEKAPKSGGVEIVESERTKRAKAREEESMTLSQMQMLAKKKKLVEGKLTRKEKEVNAEMLKAKEKEGENEKDEEGEKEKENAREEEREREKETEEETEKEKEKERETEKEKEDKEKEMVNLREKTNRRRVSKYRNLPSEKGNLEVVLLVEKENGKEKEKVMEDTREKRERRRISKYGNLEVVRGKTSKDHVDSEIERLITKKKGSLEIMPVEDSDFHDFDKDRRERSFKKGQVWAVYDDDDGMPRHYALINEVVSINPFEVTLSWLQFRSDGDEELINWQKMGFHVSCGIFQISRKVSIKYLNLFSHIVDCERAAREVYRIYPKKGSVWAMYSNNAAEAEERNQRVNDKRCYDIVVSLSSYSDIHGLSIAYLEKVSGFRTVFKRREVGVNAVICLGANDVKLFSHQIPAKKLSGEESSDLPKDCWELDPASLIPQ